MSQAKIGKMDFFDSVSWFRSYLSDREQCVDVNGHRSGFLKVSCGVPQGSILGPQLFLLYINDLSISMDCDLSLYADDSALIFAHKDPVFIADHLSKQLSSCKQWMTDNKLSLHVGKTEAILFGTKKRLNRVRGFQITCEGSVVSRVSNVKYLGVQLNENLDGRSYAECVIKRCAGRLSFLYRNAAFLDLNCRRIMCSALIQPYLDYCSASWYSGLTKQLQDKLDVLQRRMVRFIFSYHPMQHVGNAELKKLSWLSIPDRVRYFKLCHVFKIKAGTAPEYMSRHFTPLAQTHSYATRGSTSSNLFISQHASTTFSYTASMQWNWLPSFLKDIASESVFKRKLRDYLLSQY